MKVCFADLEQQIINFPSRQGDGRTYREKIVNVNYMYRYVIDPKLKMNTIIFLNVIILTKNVSSRCQIISYIRHNIIQFSELMSSKRKPILKKLLSFYKCYQYRCLSSRLLILCNLSPNLHKYCK